MAYLLPEEMAWRVRMQHDPVQTREVIGEISRALERGEMVKISSFGSFAVRQKGQRVGRNPKTGQEVPISPRRVLVFRASHALKHQINNSLATRQIRPQGVDAHEVFQTVFGYADDDEAMTRHRLISVNLVGPAGFVSMEDGEAIEVVHKATRSTRDGCAVIEMGGRGAVRDLAHRVTETPIRGFWSYWAELMGMEPAGGIK